MFDIFLAELIGTFVFLGVIITSGHFQNKIIDSMSWIKIGLALSISILLVGFISGGMLNPAVSFMLYLNNDITITKMIVSIIAQLIGAIFAFLYFKYLKKNYPKLL